MKNFLYRWPVVAEPVCLDGVIVQPEVDVGHYHVGTVSQVQVLEQTIEQINVL